MYIERIRVGQFRILMDAAFMRIAKEAKKLQEMQDILNLIDVADAPTQWVYFDRVAQATTALELHKVVKRGYGAYFLSEDYVDFNPDRVRPRTVTDYPRLAQSLLAEALVGGQRGEADRIVLWKREDGRESVLHVHPEGMWLLGQDAVDFVERIAFIAEGGTLEKIVDQQLMRHEDEDDDGNEDADEDEDD